MRSAELVIDAFHYKTEKPCHSNPWQVYAIHVFLSYIKINSGEYIWILSNNQTR